MAGIAICQNNDCIHSKECFRFIDKSGELVDFKNICTKKNNYQWLWKIENNIIKKEEV